MRHARIDYNRIQDPAGLIPADEPVFLLRGQDRLAAPLVRTWAKFAADLGVAPELVQAARDHADAIDAWPTKKTSDAPPEIPIELEVNLAVKTTPVPSYDALEAQRLRAWITRIEEALGHPKIRDGRAQKVREIALEALAGAPAPEPRK